MHPSWCDPAACTASPHGGTHSSAVTRVPVTATEPCAYAVSLIHPGDALGPTQLMLEVEHDPDISAALDMSPEPDVFLYSLSQAARLRSALSHLLDAA